MDVLVLSIPLKVFMRTIKNPFIKIISLFIIAPISYLNIYYHFVALSNMTYVMLADIIMDEVN